MATVEQFSIVLDNNKTIYHPGDQVKGRILLRLNGRSSFSMRRIIVGFYGQGHVTHRSGRARYNYTQPYFAQQCVPYDTNNEAAHQRFGGNFYSGEYWFPFTFMLPPYNLPTSYHDSSASVRYWLDAVIDRPMWFNKKIVVAIFVVEPVDVGSTELQQSQTKQDEQAICCCCVKGGKVNVSAKINKSGFYPGEVIQAKFYVENNSSREVTYTEMRLVQRLTKKYGEDSYDVTTSRTTIEAVMGQAVTGMAIPAGQDADVGGFSITVPNSIPPSTTLEDSIVSVAYLVELIAHVKGACVCSSDVEFPITIGFKPTTSGSDWCRMILQAIAQLVNEQSDQQEQGGHENQGGDDGRYDDRAMLMA